MPLDLDTLKRLCRDAVLEAGSASKLVQSDKGALLFGPLTPRIAKHCGESLDKVRRQLKHFKKSGAVIEQGHPGCISRWWVVGLWDEFNHALPSAPGSEEAG